MDQVLNLLLYRDYSGSILAYPHHNEEEQEALLNLVMSNGASIENLNPRELMLNPAVRNLVENT